LTEKNSEILDYALSIFPYEPTQIQKRILDVILTTYKRKIFSLIEAANGAGKTTCIAVAAATLTKTGAKPVIFCSSYTQISRVLSELKKLEMEIRAIVLGSKAVFCSSDNLSSPKIICTLKQLRTRCIYQFPSADYFPWLLDIDELLQRSREKKVCAYETLWQSAQYASVLIAPQAYLFFNEAWEKISKFLHSDFVMIDECHNLLNKGINVFSFELSFKSKACTDLLDTLKSRRRWTKNSLVSKVKDFEDILFRMENEIDEASYSKKNDLCHSLTTEYSLIKLLRDAKYDKLIVSDNVCEGFTGFPEQELRSRISYFNGGVMMSATPGSAVSYENMLHDKPLYVERAPNPYTDAQLQVYIVNDFTTKYSERRASDYSEVVSRLMQLLTKNPNSTVGVFLPSYKYLEQTVLALMELEGSEGLRIFHEANFVKVGFGKSSIIFMVQGGRGSEGYEYPGGLDTALIVGLALPFPKFLISVRKKLYSEIGVRNPEVPSYLSWAVQKAVQAVGRVVRGPLDNGIGILMDKRFRYNVVLDIMPYWFRKCIMGCYGFQEMLNKLPEIG